MKHTSDCAVHNAPALEPGPCNCPGVDIALDNGCQCDACVPPSTRTWTILNDLAPTDEGFGSSWKVANYPGLDDVRFTGSFFECEEFVGSLAETR